MARRRHRTPIMVATVLLMVAAAAPSAQAVDPGVGPDAGGPGAVNVVPMDATTASEAKLAKVADSVGALGTYYDSPTNEYVVVLPPSRGAVLGGDAFNGIGLSVRMVLGGMEQTDVDAITKILVDRDFDPRASSVTFGTYFDARSGKVVIGTDAPSAMFSSILAQYPGKVVIKTGTGGRQSRNDDFAPHWGGAIINSSTGGCTSGYTAMESNGTKVMVTAAHCALLGDHFYGGTGLSWGTVTARGPFPTWDVELISGSTYQGDIYGGNAAGTRRVVGGAQDPVVGATSYCVSGQTTTETCSHHAVTLSGTLCDPSGCTPGLAVYNGGTLTQGGDSGAPWFTYPSGCGGCIYIVGSHVGRFGGDMYAEHWLADKAHFTLTIVTG